LRIALIAACATLVSSTLPERSHAAV
jgi:hypothetical protein